MKLKNRLKLAAARILGWSIFIGAAVVGAAVITLIIMSWVVAVAVVFELKLPYKPIAGTAGFAALAALTAGYNTGRRNKRV